MVEPTIPTATYRLQFGREFTFRDAAELVDYLDALGISHCYASPCLRARPGSTHGYDIVDHNALNPVIGSAADHAAFVSALLRHGMGQILDVVPNHMGVGGDDNAWWLDVLENGEASPYAPFFDIDWHTVRAELRGKVLLPFLDDHYGAVLERGELVLQFDSARGAFSVRYGRHRFPLDPRTYPQILTAHPTTALPAALADSVAAFGRLPPAGALEPALRARRHDEQRSHKRELARLCAERPSLAGHIDACVTRLNGTPGRPASFDALHGLLECQPYRLAYWRVAADEVNYRRFLDNNDLAGLCMERAEVFTATHRLILDLVARGQVDGLRIDHPDGLYDPLAYLRRLTAALHAARRPAPAGALPDRPPCYLVVEKILVADERLPATWPVHGTTGYDFGALVNGLFVYPGSERALTRRYHRFMGTTPDFADILYRQRKLIARHHLSSELTVLAHQLHHIGQMRRATRDYTLNALREALVEVVACFPVYRTYADGSPLTDSERDRIEQAVAAARHRSSVADVMPFDFLRDLLLLHHPPSVDSAYRDAVVRFAMHFQQFTPPVMVKGLEDTALYSYNRLLSLNEVGDDPRRYGVSLTAFHAANHERLKRWPHAMLATSTHDSKRSEDVRARLNVLSEIPDQWSIRLTHWGRINRARRSRVDGTDAPSRNDEYLYYQTLLGIWPDAEPDDAALAVLRERLEAYLIKAAREAKASTSWINPNEAYEAGLRRFVRATLRRSPHNHFLADFLPFHSGVARYGALNSLAQTLLKLTVPGVPDIYQGNESLCFALVDPDNRRPVDHVQHRRWLHTLARLSDHPGRRGRLLRHLGKAPHGRCTKLYVTWRTLHLRREMPEAFTEGAYVELVVGGAAREHVCAFARVSPDAAVVVAVARWLARLTGAPEPPAPHSVAWGDTRIGLPEELAGNSYRDVLSDRPVPVRQVDGQAALMSAELFATFPVALLLTRRR